MATVRGGFWEVNGGVYNWPISTTSRLRDAAATWIDKAKSDRAVLLALLGVAPGANATDTYKRVIASDELGGARPIETVTNINRATTAADVTDLTADVMTYGGLDSAVAVPNGDQNPLGTR